MNQVLPPSAPPPGTPTKGVMEAVGVGVGVSVGAVVAVSVGVLVAGGLFVGVGVKSVANTVEGGIGGVGELQDTVRANSETIKPRQIAREVEGGI